MSSTLRMLVVLAVVLAAGIGLAIRSNTTTLPGPEEPVASAAPEDNDGSDAPAAQLDKEADKGDPSVRRAALSKGPEAEGGVKVLSPIDRPVAILRLAPEGTQVEKGQVVCELDSSELRDELIATEEVERKRAEVNLNLSRLAREAAELALKEYRDGIYQAQRKQAEGAVDLARSELELARAELERVSKSKLRDAETLKRARSEANRAEARLDQANSRRDTLIRETSKQRTEELEAAVEQAGRDEQAQRDAIAQAKVQAERLRLQIDQCKILSPMAGRVLYENPAPAPAPAPDALPDTAPEPPPIREGAIVQARQPIVRIVPLVD